MVPGLLDALSQRPLVANKPLPKRIPKKASLVVQMGLCQQPFFCKKAGASRTDSRELSSLLVHLFNGPLLQANRPQHRPPKRLVWDSDGCPVQQLRFAIVRRTRSSKTRMHVFNGPLLQAKLPGPSRCPFSTPAFK